MRIGPALMSWIAGDGMQHGVTGLVRSEFSRAFRNGWFIGALAVALFLAIASAVESVVACAEQAAFDMGDEWVVRSVESSYCVWTFVGNMPNLFGELLFPALPLLAVVPFSWSFQSDRMSGVQAQLYLRARRRQCVAVRAMVVFCAGAAVAMVPLVANYLVVACFQPAFVPEALDVLYIGVGSHELWADLLYSIPALYVVLNIVLDGVLTGLWAVLVLALSTAIANRVILFTGSYLVLLLCAYLNACVPAALGIEGLRFNLIDMLRAFGQYPRTATGVALMMLLMAAASAALLVHQGRRDAL